MPQKHLIKSLFLFLTHNAKWKQPVRQITLKTIAYILSIKNTHAYNMTYITAERTVRLLGTNHAATSAWPALFSGKTETDMERRKRTAADSLPFHRHTPLLGWRPHSLQQTPTLTVPRCCYKEACCVLPVYFSHSVRKQRWTVIHCTFFNFLSLFSLSSTVCTFVSWPDMQPRCSLSFQKPNGIVKIRSPRSPHTQQVHTHNVPQWSIF